MVIKNLTLDILNKTKFSEEIKNSQKLNEAADNENELSIHNTSKQINLEDSNDNEIDKTVNKFSTDDEERNFLIKKSV